MTYTIIRLKGTIQANGKSRSAHYADVQKGLCTKPVKIGVRAVGWPRHEIDALIAAQIAGKSDDEVRILVKRLEAARKEAGASAEKIGCEA